MFPFSRSTNRSAGAAAPRRLRAGLLLLAASVVFCLLAGEVILRLGFQRSLRLPVDEKTLLYRYDATLGWLPIPNTTTRLIADRSFTVVHNSRGFRTPEFAPGNRPTIVFVGDSFVWGYDADAAERFTDKLQTKHPEWAVQNLGVSGYGTDQEFLLLQRVFDDYKPRVVFLVFCTNNDVKDNTTNFNYGAYYKPYYEVSDGRLQLRGVPVPRSERVWYAQHPTLSRSYLARLLMRAWCKLVDPKPVGVPDPTEAIIAAMNQFVAAKHSTLVVGLQFRYPKLEDFLTAQKIPHVDLTTSLVYPYFGEHWTPEGHTFVANRIDEFLTAGKCLP